jgi:hypothetical protein
MCLKMLQGEIVSLMVAGNSGRLRWWSSNDQANRAAMRYYVRLCLEGLPLHLWSESFATAVVGRSCSLHFVAGRSRRREATDVFELSAWTADPIAIPLRVWVTVTDPDLGDHLIATMTIHRQRPTKPRRGMVYDALIHVVSIEDLRRHVADDRPLFFPFHFNMGTPY